MMTAMPVRRLAVAMLAAALLAGCAATLDPRGFTQDAGGLIKNNSSADRALAALSRGDYANGERYALAAVRADPKDPYALLAAGMVYQATGRYDLARQYYDVILTNQPSGQIMLPNGGEIASRSVVEVARDNLAAVDRLTGRAQPRTAAQAGRPDPFAGMTGEPGAAGGRPPAQAEANVSGRFRILKRLFDDGLITGDEFARRRNANLGALLPYSHPAPPAAGLERPLPGDDVVLERMRAQATALENREITPRELAAERGTILDALLPAEPRKIDMPALPPKDMIEAGQAVGRLERLRAAGLIGADEMAREKDAVERGLDGTLARTPVSGTATGLRQGRGGNGKGPTYAKAGQGVALATVKSEAAARQAWDKLKQKFPEQLGGLEGSVKRVDLGERGVRWKVLAGPLGGPEDARALCKTLKLHRQACDPAPFEKAVN
jgi:hypothetical protein